jgi:hypothetical protein
MGLTFTFQYFNELAARRARRDRECRTGLGDWPETAHFLDSREQGETA